MDDPVQFLVDGFNARIASDPSLRSELAGFSRTVVIDLEDRKATLRIDDKGLHPINPVQKADIYIRTTGEVLVKVLSGKLDPMRAYTEGTFKVDASMGDLWKARKLFSA